MSRVDINSGDEKNYFILTEREGVKKLEVERMRHCNSF